MLSFKVIDSGVGVQQEIIENLGEKAYQTYN